MDRRTFLKVTAGAGSLAATGGLATPAISQGAAAKTLRFVPQANLANFDPIWGTQYVVRNCRAWCGIRSTASTRSCSRSAR